MCSVVLYASRCTLILCSCVRPWSAKNVTVFIFLIVTYGTVEMFFGWGRKRLRYFVADLFGTVYGKFYQNQPSFTEDVAKTVWLTFHWDTVGYRIGIFTENRTFKFYTIHARWKTLQLRRYTNILTHTSTNNYENRTISGGVIWKYRKGDVFMEHNAILYVGCILYSCVTLAIFAQWTAPTDSEGKSVKTG